MNQSEFWSTVEKIRALDGRYTPEAYGFVMDALEYAIQQVGERRHISAAELMDGLCAFARHSYGIMSFTVLETWGIRRSEDVGSIVFQLVGEGILSRREEDSVDDFKDVVDLHAALELGYFEGEDSTPGAS